MIRLIVPDLWYFLAADESIVGPVETDAVRRGLATSQYTPTSLVCRMGDAAWVPVSSVPELSAELPFAATAPAEPAAVDEPQQEGDDPTVVGLSLGLGAGRDEWERAPVPVPVREPMRPVRRDRAPAPAREPARPSRREAQPVAVREPERPSHREPQPIAVREPERPSRREQPAAGHEPEMPMPGRQEQAPAPIISTALPISTMDPVPNMATSQASDSPLTPRDFAPAEDQSDSVAAAVALISSGLAAAFWPLLALVEVMVFSTEGGVTNAALAAGELGVAVCFGWLALATWRGRAHAFAAVGAHALGLAAVGCELVVGGHYLVLLATVLHVVGIGSGLRAQPVTAVASR